MTRDWEVLLATGVVASCSEQGDPQGAPVVLLLHPWAESRRSFDRVLPLLPPDLRVVSVDQRGHGGSSKTSSRYSLPELAEDVRALLDSLDVATAVLVGASSGGYVAQQVAVMYPERVAALVLVGSPRDLRGRPPFADDVDALVEPVDPARVARLVTAVPLHTLVPPSYLEDRIADGLALPATVWKQSLAGLTSAVPPTEAGTVRAPTLVLAGADDELLPPDEPRALTAAVPGARFVLYPRTGHLVLWERPERVAVDIVRFVRSLS